MGPSRAARASDLILRSRLRLQVHSLAIRQVVLQDYPRLLLRLGLRTTAEAQGMGVAIFLPLMLPSILPLLATLPDIARTHPTMDPLL